MTIRTITITGARGGQGTSTVAAAIALFAAGHTRTVLSSGDARSMAALLGVVVPRAADADIEIEVAPTLRLAPTPSSEDEVLVVDAGTLSIIPGEGRSGEHYAVVRGPCYLALASLVRDPGALPDGVILVAEPGRSLTARDVTEVLGVPVVATIESSPMVARTIDAGLLPSRLDRLRQLKPLRPLACPSMNPAMTSTAPSRRHPPIPACQLSDPSSTRHTDLPFPPAAETAWTSRAVKSRSGGCRVPGWPCA